MLEKYMYQISDFLVKNNKPIIINNKNKYSLTQEDFVGNEQVRNTEKLIKQVEKVIDIKEAIKVDTETYELLKKYRLNTSKEEAIKPYFIFSNAELDLLIQHKPKTKVELQQVKGFGIKKLEKYGDGILEIINRGE